MSAIANSFTQRAVHQPAVDRQRRSLALGGRVDHLLAAIGAVARRVGIDQSARAERTSFNTHFIEEVRRGSPAGYSR